MVPNALIHIFVINPVTQYLLQQKKYSFIRRVIHAVAFLLVVAVIGLVMEMQEEPENYYQFLGVPKDASQTDIRKAKREMSLKLHPDKSDSPTADRDFTFLTDVCRVLANPTKRDVYNKFGPKIAHNLDQDDFNPNDMILTLMIFYVIWSILTYVFVGSQKGAGGRSWSLSGLFLLAIFEYCMKYTSFDIAMQLFPLTTQYEKVEILKRLYPAFMHGCRIISASLFFDSEEHERQVINTISRAQLDLMQRIHVIEKKLTEKKSHGELKKPKKEEEDSDEKKLPDEAITKQLGQAFHIPPKKPLIPEGLQSILWIVIVYFVFEVLLK